MNERKVLLLKKICYDVGTRFSLNDKFKGLKDEALNYALSEFDKRKHGLEATAKIWKCLALIFSLRLLFQQ